MGIFEQIKDSIIGGTSRGILVENFVSTNKVIFDTLTKWTNSNQSQVTEHAIENGAPISDNVFNQPLEIQISGVFTDSAQGLLGLLDPSVANTRTAQERYTQLLQWQLDKQPLIFLYDQDSFLNMIILGINRERTNKLTKGMRVSLSLKNVNFATGTGAGAEVPNKGKTEKVLQ